MECQGEWHEDEKELVAVGEEEEPDLWTLYAALKEEWRIHGGSEPLEMMAQEDAEEISPLEN